MVNLQKDTGSFQKFYFTFGTEGFPFYGGWVEVFARTRSAATSVFRKYHPDKSNGVVNCADIYSEQEFSKTSMVDGNYDRKCHAVYHQHLSDDELLCATGDKIDNAVFAAIAAVAQDTNLDWDMSIIGAVTDYIESLLPKHGIDTCRPWEDAEGSICYSTSERCKYCKK